MHDLFAEWYRLASIEPKIEFLEKRGEGIRNFVSTMDENLIFEVVRLHHQKTPKDKQFIDIFREAFHKVDPLFPMRDNNLELQVLAGASIVQCIDSKSKYSSKIAMATLCLNYQKDSKMVVIPEVINISEEFLNKKALALRSREDISQIKIDFKNDELKSNVTTAFNAENLIPLIEKVENSVKQMGSSTNKAINILKNSLMAQEEETNILWWILGKYSNDLKCEMTKLSRLALTLVASKELADLTKIIPGPVSAGAFLNQVIQLGRKRKNEALTIKEIINSSPMDWRKTRINEKNFDKVMDLCPVHYAIGQSVESGDKTSWISSVENNTNIKVDNTISLSELSLQAYLESLLITTIQ